ncbi:hypothetical protein MRY87_08240 [bacterium]|nr:hypothetical protein [bacterium]
MLTPERSQPKFLGAAYDLASCGIGVQTLVVEVLTGERDSPQLSDRDIFGASSNLLLNIHHCGEHLGERGNSFREKERELSDQWSGLRRKATRALLSSHEERGVEAFQEEEFPHLMKKLFEGKTLQEEQLRELAENFSSELTFSGTMLRMDLPMERCLWFVEGLRKVLREGACAQEFLAYHLQKLTLMTEIFAADVEASRSPGDVRPPDPDGSWARNWREQLGVEMPTAQDLISTSWTTIQRGWASLTMTLGIVYQRDI